MSNPKYIALSPGNALLELQGDGLYKRIANFSDGYESLVIKVADLLNGADK